MIIQDTITPPVHGTVFEFIISKSDTMENLRTANAVDHIKNMKPEFEKLVIQLKKDSNRISDEKAKILFDLAAEVINGLNKTFTDYEARMSKPDNK